MIQYRKYKLMPFVCDGLVAYTEHEFKSELSLLRTCKYMIRRTNNKCLYVLVENDRQQRAYITIKTRLSAIIWINKNQSGGTK